MTATFWKTPLYMGKLTRPVGIMISAISITTFRQIHYLLARLPIHKQNLAAGWREKGKHWIQPFFMQKNWHCGSLFSLAKAKLLFPLLSCCAWEGGPELHTVLNTTDQSLLSGCKSIFLHHSHLCSPSKNAVPNLRAEQILLSPPNIHSLSQDLNVHANSVHGFQNASHREFRLQNKGLFHTGIFKQQGPLWSRIMPSSFTQNTSPSNFCSKALAPTSSPVFRSRGDLGWTILNQEGFALILGKCF